MTPSQQEDLNMAAVMVDVAPGVFSLYGRGETDPTDDLFTYCDPYSRIISALNVHRQLTWSTDSHHFIDF